MIDSLGYSSAKASTFDVVPTPDTPPISSLGRWHWHYRALIKLRDRLLKQRADLAAQFSSHWSHSVSISQTLPLISSIMTWP